MTSGDRVAAHAMSVVSGLCHTVEPANAFRKYFRNEFESIQRHEEERCNRNARAENAKQRASSMAAAQSATMRDEGWMLERRKSERLANVSTDKSGSTLSRGCGIAGVRCPLRLCAVSVSALSLTLWSCDPACVCAAAAMALLAHTRHARRHDTTRRPPVTRGRVADMRDELTSSAGPLLSEPQCQGTAAAERGHRSTHSGATTTTTERHRRNGAGSDEEEGASRCSGAFALPSLGTAAIRPCVGDEGTDEPGSTTGTQEATGGCQRDPGIIPRCA